MRAEIAALHKRLKTTIIYVTHDQAEAMTLGTGIAVMKDGILMQEGIPQRLYNQPDNQFVAGFIGNPQMNFTEAICKIEENRAELLIDNFQLEISPKIYRNLHQKKFTQKKVIIGIRPDGFLLSPNKKSQNQALPLLKVKVEGYEILGAEALIYFWLNKNKMAASIDASISVNIGDTFNLLVNINKIYLFDTETKRTILERV